MVFCSECGSENEDSAKFCQECGYQLIIPEIKKVTPPAIKDDAGICPNMNCTNIDKLKINSKCPECGSTIVDNLDNIRANKKKRKKGLKTLKKKQAEYGFIKGAVGTKGRLEVYDNHIRLRDYTKLTKKNDYLFKDIVSVDLKPANRGLLNKAGYIKFRIRGHELIHRGGSLVTYGSGGANLGMYGGMYGSKPITKIYFDKEWEEDFRELKELILSKMKILN
ncbi:MAG: zinc-ribbon domain-containing protein [Methanobacterium sp.]|nr:zinc-ribbon domain-containing protein [Methanobacterium sp.]